MRVLLPLLVWLGATPARTGASERPDVGALARAAPLVVRGVVVAIEPHAPFGNLKLRQATVRVTRTLKGAPRDSVTFLFGVGDASACPGCPRPKLGQDGVWVLTSPPSMIADYVIFDPLAMAPPASEPKVVARLKTPPCPERAAGRCSEPGWLCAYPEAMCTCATACPGGADHPGPLPASWVCRPPACATARVGEPCVPGLRCEGCWGTFPMVCESGQWRAVHIPPPPAHAPAPQP